MRREFAVDSRYRDRVSILAQTPNAPADERSRDANDVKLRALVDAHFDFAWRSLRALGVSASDADDACQKVFIIASRKLDAITHGSERAFLFAISRGVAANARRSEHRARERPNQNALAGQIDPAPDPEQAASRNEAKERLLRIMERMPEETRVVFVLFELEGLTMIEIAAMLDAPAGTIASRLRRAREQLEREIARIEVGGAP